MGHVSGDVVVRPFLCAGACASAGPLVSSVSSPRASRATDPRACVCVCATHRFPPPSAQFRALRPASLRFVALPAPARSFRGWRPVQRKGRRGGSGAGCAFRGRAGCPSISAGGAPPAPAPASPASSAPAVCFVFPLWATAAWWLSHPALRNGWLERGCCWVMCQPMAYIRVGVIMCCDCNSSSRIHHYTITQSHSPNEQPTEQPRRELLQQTGD